jgi:hypothetical protein
VEVEALLGLPGHGARLVAEATRVDVRDGEMRQHPVELPCRRRWKMVNSKP